MLKPCYIHYAFYLDYHKLKPHDSMNQKTKSSFLALASVFLCLITDTLSALTIGDYQPKTKTSGTIEISQLDNAENLNVRVEIDQQDVNYELRQLSNNLVIITIEDKILAHKEVLIQVTAKSEFGQNNRLFSYSNRQSTEKDINTKVLAHEKKKNIEKPVRNKVIVSSDSKNYEDDNTVEFVDGIIQVEITGINNTVSYALRQLARANNLNILMLHGDEDLYQLQLATDVSDFKDLYLASNKRIKQVLIDDERKLVRIVGQSSKIRAQQEPVPNSPASVAVKEIFVGLARQSNLEPKILLGDEKLLNQFVEAGTISTLDQLALYVGQFGSVLDIDESNQLLRVRKKS